MQLPYFYDMDIMDINKDIYWNLATNKFGL